MQYYHLGRKAIVCPACGRREFKPFVDASGALLHPSLGRCNRERRCGYFRSPRDLSDPDRRALLRDHRPGRPPRPAPASLVPAAYVGRSIDHCAERNLLRRWFIGRFGFDTATDVMRRYGVGGSRLYGGAALFWLIDRSMRVRSGKIMAYDANAHRRRDLCVATTYVHPLISPGRPFNFRACHFGAHTLSMAPDATVLLVESEKTALYLACLLRERGALFGRYTVLATGGSACGGYTADAAADPWHRAADLLGRHVVLLPDADATAKWRTLAAALRPICASVRLLDLSRLATAPTDDPMDILERRLRRPRMN